jgi:hypothetical protein
MSSPAADGVASARAKTVLAVVCAAIVIVLVVVVVNAALTDDRRLSAAERLERVQDEFGDGWTCGLEREPTRGEFFLCWTPIPGSVADLRTCDATLTADGDVVKGGCGTVSLESGGGGWP